MKNNHRQTVKGDVAAEWSIFVKMMALLGSVIMMPCSAASKVTVGPDTSWDYTTINDAVTAQLPLTEDLVIEVYVGPGGYETPGIVESNPLFAGFTVDIIGVTTAATKATYYVNSEIEYDVPRSASVPLTTTEYINGADLIARRVENGSAQSGNQYYVKNHLGSTMFLTSADGAAVIATVDYLPYGKKVHLTATPDVVTQTFTGKEMDRYDEDMEEGEDGEGWYYFGARYLDPDVGVWMSCDPEAQYFNLYSYGNTPVNGIDPDGKKFKIGIFGNRTLLSNTKEVVASGLSYAEPFKKSLDVFMNYLPVMTAHAVGRAQAKLIDNKFAYGDIFIAKNETYVTTELGNTIAEKAIIAWEIGNMYGQLNDSKTGDRSQRYGKGGDYSEAYKSMNEYLNSVGSNKNVGLEIESGAPTFYDKTKPTPSGIQIF